MIKFFFAQFLTSHKFQYYITSSHHKYHFDLIIENEFFMSHIWVCVFIAPETEQKKFLFWSVTISIVARKFFPSLTIFRVSLDIHNAQFFFFNSELRMQNTFRERRKKKKERRKTSGIIQIGTTKMKLQLKLLFLIIISILLSLFFCRCTSLYGR